MTLLCAVGLVLALVAPASAATLPAGYQEETLVAGLSQPMAVAWTPDGRTLIAEKPGRLKVAAPGATTASTVLDISGRVNANHDRGLLGVAVDSAFATNQYVYLLYTYDVNPLSPDSGGAMVSQLLRVKLSPASTITEQTVLLGSYTSGPCPQAAATLDCIPSDYDSHSIGTVRAAADGTLYVGSGDGASYNSADPRALRAYDEQSMAGKILRIDREGRGLANHPFCASEQNLTHTCTKLFAKGFRNPFRFSLRPAGGLAVGDVGWSTTEELNLLPAAGGRSYGWPCYEGAAQTGGYRNFSECAAEYAKPAGTHTAPDKAYSHASGAGSTLGGPTYVGNRYPAGLRDSVFVADYVAGWIRRIDAAGVERSFANNWYGSVDLTTQPGTGDLVHVNVGDFSDGTGSVVAIRYTVGNQAPVARIVADRTSGTAPLAVAFDGTTSSDPDADPLTYRWAFGDGTTSTAARPAKTFSTPGTYVVTLTVDDSRGRTATASATITAGNSAPTAAISAPAGGALYRGGAPVTLTGSASDPQDGALSGASLTWRIVLNHAGHSHVESDRTGPSATFTPRTDHDADSFYEITLTARDSGGLTGSRTVTIRPQTAPLTLASEPAGAPLSYGGTNVAAPFSTQAAVGFVAGLDAAPAFSVGGRSYVFNRWSDGGARAHSVTVGAAAQTLTAVYKESSGPVLALAFDETSGAAAADASGTGNNAALSGGAAFATGGRYGGAVNFNGSSAVATVADADSLDFTGPHTLEAWVRPRSRSAWRTVIFKQLGPDWQSYVLYAAAEPYGGSGAGGEPVGFAGGDGVRGPAALPLNTWSHLAATYDGAVQKLYVNGTLVASAPRTGGVDTGFGALTIGRNAVWGEAFDGLVDDVRLYARALTAAEIATDRDTPVGPTGPPPPPPGPKRVASYAFEESAGTTTADGSSFGATASVSGGPVRLAAGRSGRALDFDGVDDRVVAPHAAQLALSGAMTLSAWVRPDRTDGWRTVMLKETGDFQSYALYAAADPYGGGAAGDPTGFAGGDGVRGSGRLPTGAWSHLAFTYDGTSEKLYVDGVLRGTRDVVAAAIAGTGPLSIGGNGVWGEFFDGAIDEVHVYSSALTTAQVAADRDATLAARPARRRFAGGAGFTLERVARKPRTRIKARPDKRRTKVRRGKRAAVRAPRRRG